MKTRIYATIAASAMALSLGLAGPALAAPAPVDRGQDTVNTTPGNGQAQRGQSNSGAISQTGFGLRGLTAFGTYQNDTKLKSPTRR